MQRFYSPGTYGQVIVSYSSQSSLVTTSLSFLASFKIFMFYFQYVFMGLQVGAPFQVPLLLQFIILFVYSQRQLNLHLRIEAMNRFQQIHE